MLNKKIASEIAIGIILIIAIVIGGIFYWQNKNIQQIQEPIQKACTMEARLCADGSSVGRTGLNCEFAPCPENKTAQMANPASVYCEQNGGKSEIRTVEDGSQTGYCKFSDGSECEEWAYFRKECRNETANWRTYTNEKYKFNFKYPSYLNVTVNDFTDPAILNNKEDRGLYVDLAKAKEGDILLDLSIDKFKKMEGSSYMKVVDGYWFKLRIAKTFFTDINKFIVSWKEKFEKSGGGIVDPQSLLGIDDVLMANIPAKKLTFDGGNLIYTSIKFIKNGYLYDISFNAADLSSDDV